MMSCVSLVVGIVLIFVGWVRWNSNNTVEVLIILGCNIYTEGVIRI